MLAVANAFLITSKHVDFSNDERHHLSRDADGYRLAGQDYVPNAEQSTLSLQLLVNITG